MGSKAVSILLFLMLHIVSFAQPPKAAFSASPNSGCSPLVVTFIDQSTGTPSTWSWNLGNGSFSTKQNPSAIYINPGTYQVKLTVTNAQGVDSTKPYTITVYDKPTINFSSSVTGGCIPLNVKFTDSSKAGVGASIANELWDFGDGQNATGSSPSHIYTLPNDFSVTLTVTNSFGCTTTLEQPSFIKISPPVDASFTYNYLNACKPPTKVTFTNTSTSSSSMSYQWSFGDGNTSSTFNPIDTYNKSGTYNVQLIATSSQGCADTSIQPISIGTVNADFLAPTGACKNDVVTFTNNSVPLPQSSVWTFGDGNNGTGNDVNHSYTSTGTYNVKMTADFGGCTDTVSKTIIISIKPTADFKSAQLSVNHCGAPDSVKFTNLSIGGVSYLWDFGDGNTSTAINPTHNYNSNGNFSVTLIAINANGCSDTVTYKNLISFGAPRIDSIAGLPIIGCIPQTANLIADIHTSNPIIKYSWFFGDGGKSSDSTPTHTYSTPGVYSVILVVSTAGGCIDSLVVPNAVSVGVKPQAAFVGSPNPSCGSLPVIFKDTSKGVITSWAWYNGNQSFSTLQNPVNIFHDTGYIPITLIVGDNGCYDTLTKPKYLYLYPPVAKFFTHAVCSSPNLRTFVDSSIDAKTWSWDFGDNTTSNVQSPQHTYAAEGKYTITLTVTDSACVDKASSNIYVVTEKPSFTYTPNDTAFCRKQPIVFKATNFNALYTNSFAWNFGDSSNTAFSLLNDSLVHQYIKDGNYLPIMYSRNVNGCLDTVSQGLKYHVYGPTAAFTNPPSACLNSVVNFNDQSTSDGSHPLTKWVWSYGDSTTTTLHKPPFQHIYTTRGNYNILLTVFDSYGCSDTVSLNHNIQVSMPIVAFSLSDSIKCANNNVTFTNASQGLSLKYLWNFGNGQTSTTTSPVYNYPSDGKFIVSLIATDKNGCIDTFTDPQPLIISGPKASFNLLDTFATCPPFIISPKNTSTNFQSSYWNFSDGNISEATNPTHTYTVAGNYKLILVAQGYGQCADTASKNIILKGPSGTLHYTPLSGCAPTHVTFTASAINTVNYIWDFSNGVLKTSPDSFMYYSYKNYGNYVPKLILTDSGGCKVSIVNKDTIHVSDVAPAFTMNIIPGCDSSQISFTNTSKAYNDSLFSFSWNFGDSSAVSDSTNPTHLYSTTNNYNITLTTVTGIGCTRTITLPALVPVYVSPKISLLMPDSTCISNPVNFAGVDNTHDTSAIKWQWNFGNGTSSTDQKTQITYAKAGTFHVSLTALDAHNCHDSASSPIIVIPPPNINAGLDTTICLGQTYLLKPSGGSTYVWSSSGLLSCDSCTTPLAKPDSTTTYYVNGTIDLGCAAKDSMVIKVKQPIHLSAMANDTLCLGSSTTFAASGAEIYQWSPATFLDNTNTASPTFHASMDTAMTYTVIGKDDHNCFADTGSIQVKVYPIPTVQITVKNITMNVGESVQLNANSSPDATQWRWTPEQWLNNPTLEKPTASPQNSIVYTVVAANPGACISRDQVTITLLCNGGNIFVPNTFSPNGDGMNDKFYPRGKGLYTIKSLLIFNRWGQVVYEKENFAANDASSGWDGTFNGQKSASDVYVYIMEVICENNIIYPVKGNVALLR